MRTRFSFNIKEYAEHIPVDAGIEDEEYKLQSNAYKYAMDMTEKEVYQQSRECIIISIRYKVVVEINKLVSLEKKFFSKKLSKIGKP